MSDNFDFGTFDEKVTVNPVRQIKTKEHTKSRRKKQREEMEEEQETENMRRGGGG